MKRQITVTGNGTAQAPPDMITVSFGLECRSGSAGAAYEDAGRAAAAAASALRSSGLRDEDIRTAGLNLRADVIWQEGQGQRVTGYVASTLLTASLRDLPSASTVMAAVVDAGGDAVRVNGVELGFNDSSTVAAAAQESAWHDARAKATQFAALAGASLGHVLSVEQHPTTPGPIPMGGMMRASSVESGAIEPGETSVNASVTVAWELL